MGQVDGNPVFAIDFDFVDHQLRIHTLDGRAVAVPLQGQLGQSQPGAPLLAHPRHRPHPLLRLPRQQPATADSVSREAYSREVISFGFWFGDDRFSEPAFCGYTAPEPAGLAAQPLRPAAAWWDPRDGSHLAVLRYDDARASEDPRGTVLEFYESAYQAGARLAGWDVRCRASPGGITDS